MAPTSSTTGPSAAERKVWKAQAGVDNWTAISAQAKERLAKARLTLKTARADLNGIKKKKSTTTKKKNRTASPKHVQAKPASKAVGATRDLPACTVCHTPAVGGSLAVLRCGCTFHEACVASWASQGNACCPTCLVKTNLSKFKAETA